MQISYTKKLGQLLVEQKLLTRQQLQMALDWQQQMPGQKIGQILVQRGYISEGDLLNILQEKLNIAQAHIPLRVSAEVLGLISEATMRRLKAFPMAKDGQQLMVAMADPLDMLAIDQLQQLTNLDIKPFLTTEGQLEAVITRHFDMVQLEKELMKENDDHDTGYYITDGEDSPITRLVDGLLTQAIIEQASDVHIEPQRECVLVRQRVDGLLRGVLELPLASCQPLVSRIKILAQMDIAEKRLPQDGRFIYQVGTEKIDLRVSTIPTINGEKVVLRLLPQGQARLEINQLGLGHDNLVALKKLISSTYGMILVTGPAGSGKTTTLYAILSQLNHPTKNIITLEDPVEYSIKGINQIQIQPKTGFTFGLGLRSALRQDPDIIMVGEIRDRETAEIAIRSANTGHLVLSTLHTDNTPNAITRLLDMGVERYLVAANIIGVVAQRLVRKVCTTCRQRYQPTPQELPPPYRLLDNNTTLYRTQGCYTCGYTGYQGRTGIHEILLVNSHLRELINGNASAEQIKTAAINEGMVPLAVDGMAKVQTGITTLEEIRRVTYSAVE